MVKVVGAIEDGGDPTDGFAVLPSDESTDHAVHSLEFGSRIEELGDASRKSGNVFGKSLMKDFRQRFEQIPLGLVLTNGNRKHFFCDLD